MRLVAPAVLLVAAVAHAQAALPHQSQTSIVGPVEVSNRVDASVTTAPDTALAVSGLNGDLRVEINPTSLAALTAASGKGNCTYTESATNVAVGNTSTAIPASPMAGRTAVTLTNWSSGKTVVCVPGGTPTATRGKIIGASGGWWKWEGAAAGWVLNCICVAANGTATTGCTVQAEEEKCYQ